jgi:hypothetical protein
VVRVVTLACLVAVVLGGCSEAPPVASPGSTTEERVAVGGSPAKVTPPAAEPRPEVGGQRAVAAEPECAPSPKQQGRGCDMEGIMAAIRPLRQPGALIPACYVANVRPPRQGKMLVRFALGPAGRAGGWQWTQNDFANVALETCLQKALATVAFPVPGDKPCQVVYPFTFIPEVRSGE